MRRRAQCSPAVENVLKRGKPIASWEYFDGAISDAHAKPASAAVGAASDKVVDLSAIDVGLDRQTLEVERVHLARRGGWRARHAYLQVLLLTSSQRT